MSAATPAVAERHEHHHPAYAERAHPEHVAIDIGDGLGALIVHADADMHGVEVEISRAGEERTGAHKQVLERKIAGKPAFTLLYDGLAAGRYTLWVGEEALARDVEVKAAEIAELDWRNG